MPQVPARTSPGSWNVSKTWVAAGSFAVAVVSLAALSVVASIENAGTLATVALSLALMSFVLQILIFVIQTYSVSSQMLDAQRLYGQMADALAEIKTRAQGTQTSVDRLSDRLLEAALGKAVAESGPGDIELGSGDFARRVREALQSQTSESGEELPLSIYGPARPDREIVSLMSSWPEGDAAQRAAEVVESLSAGGRQDLARLAGDERRSRREDSTVGPGLFRSVRDPDAIELIEAGLLDVVPELRNEGGAPLMRLTEAGREAGRVFSAPPPPPEELRRFYEDTVVPTLKRVPEALRPYPLPET